MVTAKKSEFIETESGNRISRRAMLLGTQHIILGGRTTLFHDVVFRGDLRYTPSSNSSRGTSGSASTEKPAIEVGRYCYFDDGVIVRPPGKIYKGSYMFYPMTIGSYVIVHAGATIQAASISQCVQIGRNSVVGQFAIIKECVIILEGAVVPDGMVVPPFSIVGGCPGEFSYYEVLLESLFLPIFLTQSLARIVGELPESAQDVFEKRARQIFASPSRVFDDASSDQFDGL